MFSPGDGSQHGGSNNATGGSNKSYCKVFSHEEHEIMFACYQCQNTFCHKCLKDHKDHTLIYFKDKDPYIELNYEQVKPVRPEALAGFKNSNTAQTETEEL